MWVVLCCILLVSSFGLDYGVGRDVVEIEVCLVRGGIVCWLVGRLVGWLIG